MKCIDLTNKTKLTLSGAEKEHIAICPDCRGRWEDKAPERAAIINFDPARLDDNGLSNKPSAAERIDQIWPEIINLYATKQAAVSKIETILAARFADNPGLVAKLKSIAAKVTDKIQPMLPDLEPRFVAALGFYPEKEIEKMSEEELTRRLIEKIDRDTKGKEREGCKP